MSTQLQTTHGGQMVTAEQAANLRTALKSSLYPGASDASVDMVLAYCQAAGLDPMTKPVHIVPMYDKATKQMRDVVMPGIGKYRIDAARTGRHAGTSEPEFGPMVDLNLSGVKVRVPEWCRVVVFKLMDGGHIAQFVGKELWIENYATGGRDTDAPNAMWKKRPQGQIAKCFDSETEVLTTNGFERFAAVTGKVLQVSDRGLEPCDAQPFKQAYDGEMIVADGTRLNFSVTPNHDMLTTAGKIEAGDMFEQATQVGDKFMIPRAPMSAAPDSPIADSLFRLAGYFMADGSHTGYRQMRIAVSRPWKIEALRELALHQSESVKQDAGRVAQAGGRAITTISDKSCFTYAFDLIQSLISADKQINSAAVLGLSQRQARVMADALIEFDGSDNGSGVRRLHQKNSNVLRGFELLAVHAGYSVGPRADRRSDIGDACSITISDAAHFPVVRGTAKNSASLVKRRNVAGAVWCVTVPSGVIVVRRKGFSMLCGNCAEAQALRKAFPEHCSAPTADEMEGKEFESAAPLSLATVTQMPQRASVTGNTAKPAPVVPDEVVDLDPETGEVLDSQQSKPAAAGGELSAMPGPMRKMLATKLEGASLTLEQLAAAHPGIGSDAGKVADDFNRAVAWIKAQQS